MNPSRKMNAFAGPDDGDTPKAIADQIKNLFHELQAKNDERLNEMEKGIDNAITKDTLETINAKITQLQELADSQASQIALGAQQGSASDADEREHAATFLSRVTGNRVAASDASLDVGAYRNYVSSFEALVRNDGVVDSLPVDIRAALEVGTDSALGYMVPTEISSEIEKRVYDSSPMRQISRVMQIGGEAWEAPYKTSRGKSGGWVGEHQARQKTGTSDVGMQRIPVHEQYAYPEVTQTMLDDAAINVESFIVEDTEEQMSEVENLGFVFGDGNLKPTGFLSYAEASTARKDKDRKWGSLQCIPTGKAGGFLTDSSGADNPSFLIDVIAALHPTYRQGAVWTMNRYVEAEVRKLRDAQGRYLVGYGDIQDGTLGFNLHGFPIVNLEDMPDLSNSSYSIAFGNFRRGYYIIDRVGYRLLRDPYTNKPYVGYYITKRTGGDVRNFDAIKLVKAAAK